MNDRLSLVLLSYGARASDRFNVYCGATLKWPGPFPIRALKRRERRAPLAPDVCPPILRCSMI